MKRWPRARRVARVLLGTIVVIASAGLVRAVTATAGEKAGLGAPVVAAAVGAATTPTTTPLPFLGNFSPGAPLTIVWPNFGQGFESAYWDQPDGVIYNELPGNGNYGGGRCSNYVTNGSPLTAQCFIPGTATLGMHTITANGYVSASGGQAIGTALYTVLIVPAPTPTATSTPTPAASLVVQPTSGTVGQTLAFAGSGFAPREAVTISVDITTAPALAVAVARGDGSLAATEAVPELTYGPHTFIAQGQQSGRTATAGFTMRPLLRLQPNVGPVGSIGAATGYGFAATETVLLHWDAPTGPALHSAVTGRKGVVTMGFVVPDGAPSGQHLVYAVGQVSHAVGVALFTVP